MSTSIIIFLQNFKMVYFTLQNNKFPKFIMIKKRFYDKITLIRKRFINNVPKFNGFCLIALYLE